MSTDRRRAGNLPAELDGFIGRGEELATIRRLLLGTSPLVTLTGPGGVGKTRLALHAAAGLSRSFADGVWVAGLADLENAELLEQTVARSLGLRGQSDASFLAITEHLAGRSVLLVLDNCEHLIDAAASLADRLVRSCPELRLLATSREVLRISGETFLEIPPLGHPGPELAVDISSLERFEAIQLFTNRASLASPGFRLTGQNAPVVAKIVQQLDGLPLAIELASALLRTFSPGEIAERLDQRFRLLVTGHRTVHTRHQTMRTCVEWSYQQCSSAEQALWDGLSVFVGGFELDAMEGVCAQGELEGEVLVDLLHGLVDKSVIARVATDGPARFRMLETIRLYGLERLKDSGLLAETRARHRDWFFDLVIGTREALLGPGQRERWRRLDRELPNLQSAFDLTLLTPGAARSPARMVVALQEYWSSRGWFGEGRRWVSRITSSPETVRDHTWLLMLGVAGTFAGFDGDLDAALRLVEEGQHLADELGDELAAAYASRAKSLIAFFINDLPGAIDSSRFAVDVFRRQSDGAMLMIGLVPAILSAGFAGELAEAREAFEEARTISEATGDMFFRTVCTGALGVALWAQGELEEASELLRDSIRYGAAVDDLTQSSLSIELLAMIAAAEGEHERASILLGVVDSLRQNFGTRALIVDQPKQLADLEAAMRSGLGTAAHRAAVQRGQEMAYDEATAFAIDDSHVPTDPTKVSRTSVLTARESEVAALVASGLTNRQIAQRLFVTPRTVRGHIEKIFTKLGFDSRAQIATWYAKRR